MRVYSEVGIESVVESVIGVAKPANDDHAATASLNWGTFVME
jgi:hypothetical protein